MRQSLNHAHIIDCDWSFAKLKSSSVLSSRYFPQHLMFICSLLLGWTSASLLKIFFTTVASWANSSQPGRLSSLILLISGDLSSGSQLLATLKMPHAYYCGNLTNNQTEGLTATRAAQWGCTRFGGALSLTLRSANMLAMIMLTCL